MGWRKNWPTLVGGVFLFYRVGVGLLDWAGRAEYVRDKLNSPGFVGMLVQYLIIPPGWLTWSVIASGLLLIWMGLRRRQNLLASSTIQVRAEAPSPISLPPFGGLTNSQLKERTISTANQMRTFEGRYKGKIDKLLVGYQRPSDMKDRAASWAARNGEQAAMHANMETEFRNSFRPEAMVLRDELLRRLGAYPPAPADGLAAAAMFSGKGVLDTGMLAGSSPISAAADLLEMMARGLP
jgi:hypothetical protein